MAQDGQVKQSVLVTAMSIDEVKLMEAVFSSPKSRPAGGVINPFHTPPGLSRCRIESPSVSVVDSLKASKSSLARLKYIDIENVST